MHKQTVCKVLNKFQRGKYLVAYVLKGKNALPLGTFFFLLREVLISNKDAIEENRCLIQ